MPKSLKDELSVELRQQERLAQKQNANKKYDQNGRLLLDPKIYGPTKSAGVINMAEELEFFREANIIDDSTKDLLLGGKGEIKMEQTMDFDLPETTEDRPQVKGSVLQDDEELCPYCQGEGKIKKDVKLTDEEKMKFLSDDLSKRFVQAPNVASLKNWKEMHGSIYVTDLGDEVFIYRYLKHQEYKQLLTTDWVKAEPMLKQYKIVKRCLLWPILSPEKEAGLPGGAIEMLFDQINHQSMFLDPNFVANNTMKI